MEEKQEKRDSIFSSSKGDERRSLNKIEIVSIRILERWDECINTFQLWHENKLSNTTRVDKLRDKIRGVLYALFIMNREMFKRRLENNAFDSLSEIKTSQESDYDIENVFEIMNKCFDDLGLVRVDLKRRTDTLEELNKRKGFD